jgi:hypothetical protein
MGPLGRLIASALFHGLIQVSAVDQVDWMIPGLDWRAGALIAAQGLEVHACPVPARLRNWGSRLARRCWWRCP